MGALALELSSCTEHLEESPIKKTRKSRKKSKNVIEIRPCTSGLREFNPKDVYFDKLKFLGNKHELTYLTQGLEREFKVRQVLNEAQGKYASSAIASRIINSGTIEDAKSFAFEKTVDRWELWKLQLEYIALIEPLPEGVLQTPMAREKKDLRIRQLAEYFQFVERRDVAWMPKKFGDLVGYCLTAFKNKLNNEYRNDVAPKIKENVDFVDFDTFSETVHDKSGLFVSGDKCSNDISAKILVEQVEIHLSKIEEGERGIFVKMLYMFYAEKMTDKEVSTELDLSIETVRSYKSKMRDSLQSLKRMYDAEQEY